LAQRKRCFHARIPRSGKKGFTLAVFASIRESVVEMSALIGTENGKMPIQYHLHSFRKKRELGFLVPYWKNMSSKNLRFSKN